MRTKEEIEQKIAALEAQKTSIITEFNAIEVNFRNHAARQQQTVTHIEGRIIQLQEDLKEFSEDEVPPTNGAVDLPSSRRAAASRKTAAT